MVSEQTLARIKWPEHLGLIVTTATFGVVVSRLLGFAGFDPQTASAIVSAGGATNVALAVALTSVPLVGMALTLPAAIAFGSVLYEEGAAWLTGRTYALLLGVFVALFLMPISFVVGGVLIVFAYGVARWWRSRHPATQKSPRRSSLGLRCALPAWLGIAVLTMSVQPYLPAEAFMPEGGEPYQGYLIGHEPDGSLIVLTGEDSKIVREAPMTQHDLCSGAERSWASVNLPTAIKGQRYPNCPN
jgi:UPF0716 family protein affecting phage T7 exclusion